MGNKYQKVHIHPLVLIRTWKKIRDNKDKNKVWVGRDFYYSKVGKHLDILIKLGLIERVGTVYTISNRGRRNIKGYRLIKTSRNHQ